MNLVLGAFNWIAVNRPGLLGDKAVEVSWKKAFDSHGCRNIWSEIFGQFWPNNAELRFRSGKNTNFAVNLINFSLKISSNRDDHHVY